MRIYLSAAYARRNEIAELAFRLRNLGADVVSTWHDGSAENEHKMLDHQRGQAAAKDLCEVQRCDVLLALTDAMTPDLDLSGGMRHVEFGTAWAIGKRIWRVGPADHIGHNLPGVFVLATVEALIEHVEMACGAEVKS